MNTPKGRLAAIAEKAGPVAALNSALDQWRSRPLSQEDKAVLKEALSKTDLNEARKKAEERGHEEIAALIRQYQELYGAMEVARQKLLQDLGPEIGKFLVSRKTAGRRRSLYRKRRATRKRRTTRKH